jgi:hypothetical protein
LKCVRGACERAPPFMPWQALDARLCMLAAIRLHVWFGTAGVLAPLIAFFVPLRPDQGKICMAVALAAELVHAATALKMMPNVFGT